jgi:two-component system, cell cycle sensor histidine kinase and response regulator CckA
MKLKGKLNMKYLDKIGYRERIMAAFSLLTIVIILILYFVISFNQQKMLEENLDNRIRLFSNIFQTIIYEETGSLDLEKYDLLLDTFGEYKAFKYIQIYDRDLNLIKNNIYDYDYFNNVKVRPITDIGKINSNIVNELDEAYYDIIFPIKIKKDITYYARVGFDFSYQKKVSEYNKDYYILTFIIALILANLLSFLIGNSLDKKIKQLVNYLEDVSEGKLDLQFDFKWGSELGKLASAFNIMVNKLEDSQGKLQTYQHSLEQKIAEQNKILFESEEKYRNLVEASPNVILIIQNRRIVFSNNSIKKLFGINPKDAIDTLIDDLQFLSEKDRSKFSSDLDRISPSDSTVYNFDFTAYDVNRKEYMVEISVHRIQHNHNDAFQVIARDITHRKKFENELLQFQKMESIGTLAGGVAHDFNNVLGVIIPNAEMIKKNSIPSGEIYRDADQIESAALKASELTSKLLSFSRKEELKKEIIHPNQIIENILKLITRVIGKNIDIETKLETKIKNIDVDINQIEQVILNIVLNAQDAMIGGGKLLIKTDMIKNVPMEFSRAESKAGQDIVRIQITDNGKGMDSETQKRIFEPFFTTKKPGHGTGLGLSTVYGILKNHNGTIFVKSKPDHGTTFTILLPCTDEKVVFKEETVMTFKKRKGLILIVEDEEMMLETCKNLCEHLGFDVLTANDGETGITLYKKNKDKITLVILDMEMPGLNGLETFNEIKKIDKNLKVIISSGFSMEGNVKTVLNKGAKTFLKKPYRLKELSKSINSVIDN